ncbi:copper(I)-binding protein CorA [Crenothrix polyspora]|uniref:Putative Copper-repressible polypeptide n=1 Tax=Crenothrix polyspora TaxID=360316 RepID=A0A1R4H2L5_9GAMM|nr:copper(I)-binding protein CorA [Crenothrix polyspora]SJM90463.1 putative Copper-repressible polypeptide [Crenothrix polyspora]
MKTISTLLSAAVISLISVSASQATTQASTVFHFDMKKNTDNFEVRASGWSDPKFGDLGWVHSSDWGTFNAVKGQVVTITMTSSETGFHPGSTVYFRGADDTADNSYIPDVALTQTATMAKWGASNDDTGEPLGDIVMKYITHGYDGDGAVADVAGDLITNTFKKINDGVPGKLVIKFKAPFTGLYEFVSGGYKPAPTINKAIKHIVKVKVIVK